MSVRKKSSSPAASGRRALAERVVRAARESSTAGVLFHAALAARLGLTSTDHKALEVLDRLGPQTAGEIATHTGLAAASITALIDRLEAKGLVRRERDAVDRRRVNVVPTNANDAEVKAMFGPAGAAMAHLLDRYDDKELNAIAEFLETGAKWAREQTAKLDNR